MMGVKTPIIALTGNAMQSDRELFFEAGVNDFQTKVSHIFWKLNSVTLF
jgi:CheY-like chemotaxis protein